MMRSLAIVAGAIAAAVLALILIRAVSPAAPGGQPARPALPATVTWDGTAYPCAPVRQDWASGNMDGYLRYPAEVQLRCTAG